MLEVQAPTSSSTEIKDKGYSPSPDTGKQSRMKVTLLLLVFRTSCVSRVSLVLFFAIPVAHTTLSPTTFPLLPISVSKVACGTNSVIRDQV
jgi:hypothetical protein